MFRPLIDAAGRLGDRPAAKLIYLGTALQLILSALIFLFDSGFPVWIVATGWIILLPAVGIRTLRERQRRQHEAFVKRRRWTYLQSRKTILRELLSGNPGFQTDCLTCRHRGKGDDSCRINAPAGERNFRFHTNDPRAFCLHWDPPQPE